MTYEELKKKIDESADNTQLIDRLMVILKDENNVKHPPIEDYKKEYEPKLHPIVKDLVKRPDKIVKDTGKGTDDKPSTGTKIVYVNRIALPFQIQIVESRVNFAFGTPVKLESAPKKDSIEEELVSVVDRIGKLNKIDTINREFAREAHRATIVAECWFFDKSKGFKYGTYQTDGKIKCRLWLPWEGNLLFPLKDDTGDLIAFTRQITIKDEDNQDIIVVETYTDEFRYEWRQGGQYKNKWTLISKDTNIYGKIPVVYVKMDRTAWDIVSMPIERLENIVSNLGDTNDYHAAPKIFTTGAIQSFTSKGESGGIIQGKEGAKAEYLSWDRSPESQKLEVEIMLRFIYGFSNMPDTSFQAMSKMTNPSGETMKMMFMAAHLQVKADSEKYSDWMDRRYSLLKAMIAYWIPALKPACETLDIDAKITPFIIDDTTNILANLSTATGGKASMSQKTAVGLNPLIKDAQKEMDLLTAQQDEQDARDNLNAQAQNVAF